MSKTEPPRPFDKSPGERRRDWLLRNWQKLTVVSGLVAGILAAPVAISAITGFTLRDLASFGPRPFKPAGEGEVLVIVTDFDQSGGIIADNRIYRALRDRVKESGPGNAQVERLKGVMPLAKDEAVAVGEQYHATVVIWGTADNVAFEPRYEVIAHSDLIPYRMELESTPKADFPRFQARIKDGAPLEFEYLMLFSLGQIAYFSGEYEEAVVLYSQALDLLPSFSHTDSLDPEVVYDYRGIARTFQGDLEGAIADFNRAIELAPKLAASYTNRGIARHAQGDLEGAIADYDRAIEIDPEYAGAYNNRGVARGAQGDLEGAIADSDRAIELDPEYALAYINRGVARRAQGDLEGAIADFDRAIDIDPEFAPAYINRGCVRDDQGDLEGAIADFDRAIDIDPEYAKAYYNRGITRGVLGDLEGAITDYSRAIELDPEYALAYINRGNARYTHGDLEGAIADYSQAIELAPEFAAPYYNRALIYDDQGNVEAALADYIRYLELKDTEDWSTAYARERIEALRAK